MAPQKYILKSPFRLSDEHIYQEIEFISSIVVLVILVAFAYINLFRQPYLGFSVNWQTGTIWAVDSVAEDFLQRDDQILTVNSIPHEQIQRSIWLNPFEKAKTGEILVIRLSRSGEEKTINYPKPSREALSILQILSGNWIFPFPFFAAGLITILFIRPRTKIRQLLTAFFYLYALWMSAGSISGSGYWLAQNIFRISIWISVPVSLHLHWHFPESIKPLKQWVIYTHYGFFVLLSLLEVLNILPDNAFLMGFVISISSSLTVLILKWRRSQTNRKIMKMLIFAYGLATVPSLILVVLIFFDLANFTSSIPFLGLTALPGFYFYSAYQTHIKQKIPRVNKALNWFLLTIVFNFLLSVGILIFPRFLIHNNILNFLSFLFVTLFSLSNFGILLIIPALVNDEGDLFKDKPFSLRISANRASAFIFYLLLIAPTTLLILLIIFRNAALQFSDIFIASLTAIVITGLSSLLYSRYEHFFDQRILGIKYTSSELIHNYAQRITKRLDIFPLARLLRWEVLPSLLIRESALFYYNNQGKIETLFTLGVDSRKIDIPKLSRWIASQPDQWDIQYLLKILPWVRLVIPLTSEKEVVGIWCFGHKDPYEVYNQQNIQNLEILANQTTLALLNIRQATLLQKLINTNIEHQETELSNLARELHDVLIPSITALVDLQAEGCTRQTFEERIQQVNNTVRQLMSELRPAALDMGLKVAIDELIDEPMAQIGEIIIIESDLDMPEPIAYDPTVELHLYRMVQEACRNALMHGQADSIRISGTLHKDIIELNITDNGKGFEINESMDLGSLIANQHYGLANMFERAKIINANIIIQSSTNQGTNVNIRWESDDGFASITNNRSLSTDQGE